MEVLSPQEPEITDVSAMQSVHLPHDSMVTVRLSEPPTPDFEMQSSTLADLQEEPIPETPTKTLEQLARVSGTVGQTRSSRHSSIISVGDDTMEVSSISAIRRASHSSTSSAEGDVNWEELEKTEDQEPRDQDSEEVSQSLSILLYNTDTCSPPRYY
jgi:hypothetical protein